MRGKVFPLYHLPSFYRITPAYAGKSFIAFSSDDAFQDHPRLCGEKVPVPHTHILDMGSPPPMRGKD